MLADISSRFEVDIQVKPEVIDASTYSNSGVNFSGIMNKQSCRHL